jgi:hypothetical protein
MQEKRVGAAKNHKRRLVGLSKGGLVLEAVQWRSVTKNWWAGLAGVARAAAACMRAYAQLALQRSHIGGAKHVDEAGLDVLHCSSTPGGGTED